MESHEVLKEAITSVGAKSVAADMSLSSSLIYKWCEAKDSPDAGGADNPMDRLAKILDITGDRRPIEWLCQQADGYFVPNSQDSGEAALPLLSATQQILHRFSELLDAVSRSVENDGVIDRDEDDLIRAEWEELKQTAEGFVTACEEGVYRT